MFKRFLIAMSAAAGLLLSGEVASAGHRHYYGGYGVGVYGVPAAYAVPVVGYQPAYVVPPTPVVIASYPMGAVAYGSPGFAPMVPVAGYAPVTAGYYGIAPAPYIPVVPVSRRSFRPRDVEIKLDFRRDGGYRYKLDFD